MWLINTKTLELELFLGNGRLPSYAILSHTWESDEMTFQEFKHDHEKIVAANRNLKSDKSSVSQLGLQKILYTCRAAKANGLEYAWVDTVCIDKTSSTELSESINSMFRWYERSAVCYAYLADVEKNNFEVEFDKSRWFTRGWTLQELLAPSRVDFFDKHWNFIDQKDPLASKISKITSIDESAIIGNLGAFQFSAATRMSWASQRKTSRPEDIAYCLLGLFYVHMPLLYGEGGEAAFQRLQKQILEQSGDLSLLCFDLHRSPERIPPPFNTSIPNNKVLANSPADFADSRDVETIPYQSEDALVGFLSFSQFNLQVNLPVVRKDGFGCILLPCRIRGSNRYLALGFYFHESKEIAEKLVYCAAFIRDRLTRASCTCFPVPDELLADAKITKFTIFNGDRSDFDLNSPEQHVCIILEKSYLADKGWTLAGVFEIQDGFEHEPPKPRSFFQEAFSETASLVTIAIGPIDEHGFKGAVFYLRHVVGTQLLICYHGSSRGYNDWEWRLSVSMPEAVSTKSLNQIYHLNGLWRIAGKIPLTSPRRSVDFRSNPTRDLYGFGHGMNLEATTKQIFDKSVVVLRAKDSNMADLSNDNLDNLWLVPHDLPKNYGNLKLLGRKKIDLTNGIPLTGYIKEEIDAL